MSQLLTREVFTFQGSDLTADPQDFGTPLTIAVKKWAIINASTQDIEVDDGSGQDSIYVASGACIAVGEGELQEGKALNIQYTFPLKTQLTITGVTGSAGTGTITIYLFGDA